MPMMPIMRPPVMPDMMGVLCSCREQRDRCAAETGIRNTSSLHPAELQMCTVFC